MKKWIAVYVIGWALSTVIMAGWCNAELKFNAKHEYKNLYENDDPLLIKARHRNDWGFAVTWSMFASTLWPIMLPVCYLKGTAQYGWTLSQQPEQQ